MSPLEQLKRDYLLAYGSQSNAWFHLQEGLSDFHLPGVGWVSFHLQAGLRRPVAMVFVKPLCADSALPALLDAFLAAHGPAAIFLGMDAATAALLGERGFSVNAFGVEFSVDLPGYSLAGRAMKHLRNVRHNGAKGVEVLELADDDVDREELRRISEEWLGRRRVRDRELRFLTRPPDFGPAWGIRKFYCFKDGQLVGFVFFDPFFRAGRCIGYCANILRCRPGLRPPGILDYAVLTALQRFRAEGIEQLALGIAPLHGLRPCPGEDRLLRLCGQLLYRWGGALYNFRELAFHKSRFRGQSRPVYFCKREVGRAACVALSLRATRVL
jgi:lysylphosphatidylglycerol synthetase-like protein (DUF2156 family)